MQPLQVPSEVPPGPRTQELVEFIETSPVLGARGSKGSKASRGAPQQNGPAIPRIRSPGGPPARFHLAGAIGQRSRGLPQALCEVRESVLPIREPIQGAVLGQVHSPPPHYLSKFGSQHPVARAEFVPEGIAGPASGIRPPSRAWRRDTRRPGRPSDGRDHLQPLNVRGTGEI